MTRRRFTPAYKQEAVQLAQQSNIPISHVASNLGINDNVLRRWIKASADSGKSLLPEMGCHAMRRWLA